MAADIALLRRIEFRRTIIRQILFSRRILAENCLSTRRKDRLSPATDAFQQVIEQAVETAMRKALNLSEVTNRRLFTVAETAVYLSLSEREIYNMIANDNLPVVQHGRRTMLDIRDLESWIERNKRQR